MGEAHRAVTRAAYRLDGSEQVWLEGVLDAAAIALDGCERGLAATFDARGHSQVEGAGPRLHLGTLAGRGMWPGWQPALRLAMARSSSEATQRLLRKPGCGTISQGFGVAFKPRSTFRRAASLVGVADALGIVGSDPAGFGCFIVFGLPQVRTIPADVSACWARVAMDIVAAYRLRSELRATMGKGAEAILDMVGTLRHAEDAASSPDAREALRTAAVLLGRAARGDEPERARQVRDMWSSVVRGRWSLIDCFTRDGRRHVVARKNDPTTPDLEALTPRQKQVVGLIALGNSSQKVAHTLGLSEPAVSNHLKRAAQRLRASSRIDLVRKFLRYPDSGS